MPRVNLSSAGCSFCLLCLLHFVLVAGSRPRAPPAAGGACAFCFVVGDLCMVDSVRGARRRLACGGASDLVFFMILLEYV